MRIQAKDVQVGMTVTWGVVTIAVQRIVPFEQKNGKTGRTFYGSAKRSFGRNIRPAQYDMYDISPKDETWLTVKDSI